jgi:hypothetical protein
VTCVSYVTVGIKQFRRYWGFFYDSVLGLWPYLKISLGWANKVMTSANEDEPKTREYLTLLDRHQKAKVADYTESLRKHNEPLGQ